MKKRISVLVCLVMLLTMLTVFVAGCSGQEYKITFYDGDKVYDTITTGGKEEIKLPTNPVKAGYTFGGWFLDKEMSNQLTEKTYAEIKLKEEVNVYAKWTANDNTVIFNANGGTGVVANQVIKTGETAKLTANTFAKDGYAFAGWATKADGAVAYADSANYTMVAGGVTLFAIWTANSNTVIFNANGGTGEVANQVIKTGETAKLTINTFAKDGYAFAGWATTADGVVAYADGADYTMATSGVTLFAIWTANDNTVIFNANGGTGTVANQIIKTGATAKLTINTYAKDGYTFAGWATINGGAVAYTDGADYAMATSGVTLFAVWTANDNTVNFYINNGEMEKASQVIKTGATATLNFNEFYNSGYAFAGWATTADGPKAYDDGAEYTMGATSVVELFAVWMGEVDFDKNGGDGVAMMNSQVIQAGATAKLTTNTYTKAGYVFDGWATTADVKALYADGADYTMKDSPVTLFATWTIDISGMVFEERQNAAYLTKYNGSAPYVIVPGTYNGLPVVRLENTSFNVNKTIEKVDLPSSVSVIASLAFAGCIKLTSINIEQGSKLRIIGERAFTSAPLKEFTLPAGVQDIGDGVSYSSFFGNKIEKIKVDPGNSTFVVTNNCLINDKTDMLMAAAYTSNVVIPTDGSVTSIALGAFHGNDKINKIIIPNQVTSIGDSAFNSCYVLNSIILPQTVASVGRYAFFNSYRTVYYEGATIPADTTKWNADWRDANSSVITNCALSADKSYVVSFTRQVGNIIEASDKRLFAPYREGYTFGGWYQDKECTATPISDIVAITPGTTAYAKWTGKDSALTFDANGGTGVMAEQTIKNGDTVRLTANTTITNAPYTFAGWATTKGGDVAYMDNAEFTMPIGGATLYAVWTGTITFDKNGGDGVAMADQIIQAGATAKLTTNTYTKAGYAFAGWATTTDGAKVCDDGADYTISGNPVKLFAMWVVDITGMTFAEYGSEATLQKYTGTATTVVIPSRYNNKPVTKINTRAFADCANITSLTIADSVINIGDYAFANCSGLVSLTIPDSVTKLGDGAFMNCGMTTVKIGSGMLEIREKAFKDCAKLQSIIIPDSVTKIGILAFGSCAALASVKIGSNVASIGQQAFNDCVLLTSIIIPNSVTTMDTRIFDGCTTLATINCVAAAKPIGWSDTWQGNCSGTATWGYIA